MRGTDDVVRREVSAISSPRKREGAVVATDVATLARALEDRRLLPAPLLVVRVRGLEGIAWRDGREAARNVESRSLRSFVATAGRALRAGDLLAHDDGSEDFLVVLGAPHRDGAPFASPADCRATLSRLASAMELAGGMRVETGWTVVRRLDEASGLAIEVETALERGSRERERYAFFATIGHELRTPLTSIRGFLETLLEDDLDAQTSRRFLEIVRHEALRLGRLVDGMFEVSLLDARRSDDGDESCDLAATVAAALGMLAPEAAAYGVTLANVAFEPHRVAVSRERATQIITNVLENAIRYGRRGGNVYVSASLLDTGLVEVRIDDDGPGVAPADREKIFSLSRAAPAQRGHGAGIGLAVARLILERLGGEVDVVRSLMGGAQFRLRLPLVPT